MPRVLCRFVLLMLPPMAAPLRIFDRASVLHGVSVGLLTSQWAATVSAAERGPAAVQLLEARKQLEPCEALISEGSWDGVRTAIKTAPLAKVKAIVTSYIDELDDEGADDLVVVREDLVQVSAQPLGSLDLVLPGDVDCLHARSRFKCWTWPSTTITLLASTMRPERRALE